MYAAEARSVCDSYVLVFLCYKAGRENDGENGVYNEIMF